MKTQRGLGILRWDVGSEKQAVFEIFRYTVFQCCEWHKNSISLQCIGGRKRQSLGGWCETVYMTKCKRYKWGNNEKSFSHCVSIQVHPFERPHLKTECIVAVWRSSPISKQMSTRNATLSKDSPHSADNWRRDYGEHQRSGGVLLLKVRTGL